MKMALAMMLMALALIFGAAGCLIIPTPHSDSGYARTNINQHVQEQFVPGRTTREDVIMTLGEPDAVSMDEQHLAYRSEKVVALWVVGGGYSAAGGTIYKNRFYVLEFDSQGRFQTVQETGQWGMVEGAHEPELANSSLYLTSSNRTVVNMGRGAFWLADINGFQGWRAQSTLGEAGQFLLTESNLVFTTESQFANAEPKLKLPLTSITNVCMAKYFLLRRLVVFTDAGKIHSFEITKPSGLGGVAQDTPAMLAACDFIQSKLKPTRPEP